jgi:hypothetical protein
MSFLLQFDRRRLLMAVMIVLAVIMAGLLATAIAVLAPVGLVPATLADLPLASTDRLMW